MKLYIKIWSSTVVSCLLNRSWRTCYFNLRKWQWVRSNKKKPLKEKQEMQLNTRLKSKGFELLENQKQGEIEKIKSLQIQEVQSGELENHFSITDFLIRFIHKVYSQLSSLFSEVEGITIEQFFILQKIEKVKEWLIYAELNLSEIVWKLGYSNVSHLPA